MIRQRRQNILVVKLTSFGDVIHATPCLRALRLQFPDANLWMAIDRSLTPLVEHCPHLDGVISVRDGRAEQLWRIASFGGRLSLKPPIAFDLAIDLQGTARSMSHVRASKASRTVGRGDRSGYDVPVNPDLARHAVQVCADVLEAIDVPVVDLAPELFLSAETEREVEAILQKSGLPGAGFVVVNPFSRWPAKEWPAERFAAVIERVCRNHDCHVVITGGPGEEREDVRTLLAAAPGRLVSFVGQLSLAQSLCVYRRAALMITGDSGPMHAAAALGTRVIALFGPTYPERNGPWGDGHVILQASRPNRHHAYRSIESRAHLLALPVADVGDAAEALLLAIRRRDNAGTHRPIR